MEKHNVNDDEMFIDLKELFFVLLGKWWLIILTGIITGALAFGATKFMIPEKFSSSSAIYVMNRQNEATLSLSDLQSGMQLTKDYKELIISRTVLEDVIKELNLPLSVNELKSCIEINTPSDTRIIQVKVTCEDPSEAQAITKEVTETGAEIIKEVMQLESVTIFEEASYSDKPVSPNVKKNTMLGVLAGMFLVCAVVVILYLLNDTITTEEDVERYLEIGVLGAIPIQQNVKKTKNKQARKK